MSKPDSEITEAQRAMKKYQSDKRAQSIEMKGFIKNTRNFCKINGHFGMPLASYMDNKQNDRYYSNHKSNEEVNNERCEV